MKQEVKSVQINMRLTAVEKRKLQDLANINSDGDMTALVRMLINGEDIKEIE